MWLHSFSIHFFQSCRSLEEHLDERRQPYLLASGTSRRAISSYIVMDKTLILCQGTTSLAAFDELFKVHLKHFAACITSSRPLSLVLMWEPPKQPQKLRTCEPSCWMMYRCYVCRTLHHSRAYLIRHLKLSHGLYPGKKFHLLCAQDGCSLEFKSYCGFRRQTFSQWHWTSELLWWNIRFNCHHICRYAGSAYEWTKQFIIFWSAGHTWRFE